MQEIDLFDFIAGQVQKLALGDWDDLQMGLKYHIIPRPQRRQETIASMLVLIWTHVGPTSPSPKIARQGYGGRLPLCGILSRSMSAQVMNGPKATSALSPFDSQLRTLVGAAHRSHSCHKRL